MFSFLKRRKAYELERKAMMDRAAEGPEPSKDYLIRLAGLEDTLHQCLATSQQCAGKPAKTSAHYYASLLFTAICTRGVSLIMLAPHSPWAQKVIEHWDYGTMTGMVRSILELRISFFYLCVEQCSADEWSCRWNIFNIHDCSARLALFEEMKNSGMDVSGDLEGFQLQANELRARLESNAFFEALPEGQKKQLLNGKTAYLSSLEDIAVRAGVDLGQFRVIYKLFSAHVHGLPASFYRMDSQNRGRGLPSPAEEGYTQLCLSFSIKLLLAANAEMQALFKNKMNSPI